MNTTGVRSWLMLERKDSVKDSVKDSARVAMKVIKKVLVKELELVKIK